MSSTKINSVQQLLDSLEKEADNQGMIYCRLCSSAITSRSEQIKIGLSHRHHFTNLQGDIDALNRFNG